MPTLTEQLKTYVASELFFIGLCLAEEGSSGRSVNETIAYYAQITMENNPNETVLSNLAEYFKNRILQDWGYVPA